MPSKRILSILLLLCSFNLAAFELLKPGANSSFISAQAAAPNNFNFTFPDIDLLDHNDQSVSLNSLFNEEKNVVFAFFFTHCVSVCTTVTLSLKSIQPDLPDNTLIAMISIDPNTDRPDVLKTYADRHRIDDPNWYLLTGDNTEIINLQKSFEAYRGNKMNHSTSLFIKKANSEVVTEVKNNFANIPSILKNS